MSQYINAFHAWLKNEDKAEQTIRSYLTTIRAFAKWLEQSGESFELINVNPIQLMDYRSYLLNNLEQKPSSVNRSIAALKTFFQWAVEAKIISISPAAKVKMKRVQQNLGPKWLTAQEQNKLMYALQSENNETKQARDKAIMLTMLLAGLRVEEVSELKTSHLDMKQNLITVLDGKGGKYRVIPLHQDLKKAFKIWINFRKTSEKGKHQESPYLFVSERSGQLTTRGIAFMVDGYMERSGLLERSKEGVKLKGKASCHSLRHTFCKSLVDVGVPIQNIAKLAGHDSILTTQRYIEPSEDDLRKAIQSL